MMNLGFTNDRSPPRRARRRRPFDSPTGSSTKETEASIDERLEDRSLERRRRDYGGDVSQSSWEREIVVRDDMLVLGRNLRPSSKDSYTFSNARDQEEEEVDLADEDAVDDDDTLDSTLDSPEALRSAWRELTAISDKLRLERDRLRLRESALDEREAALVEAEAYFDRAVDEEVERRLSDAGDVATAQSSTRDWKRRLEDAVKNHERLKTSYEGLRVSHAELKEEHRRLTSEAEALTSKNSRLKARVTNLERLAGRRGGDRSPELRKGESGRATSPPMVRERSRSDAEGAETRRCPPEGSARPVPQSSSQPSLRPFLDLVLSLLEWLLVHLDRSPPDVLAASANSLVGVDRRLPLRDRCHRTLPPLVAVLPLICGGSGVARTQLPALKFLHWALAALEEKRRNDEASTTATPTASLRHLGEIVWGEKEGERSGNLASAFAVRESVSESNLLLPYKTEKSEGRSSSSLDLFFRSPNLHARFLSCLLILRTLSRADVLAKVLETLRSDLKSETAKEYFVLYRATRVLLHFLRPAHKTGLLAAAVDVLDVMGRDSLSQPAFLQSCSGEGFFRQISALLRTANLSASVLEKIAGLLAKLSKFHSNRRHFEAFAFPLLLSKMLAQCGPDRAFLALTLKSVLHHLGAAAAASSSTKLGVVDEERKRHLSLQSNSSSENPSTTMTTT